MPHFLVCKPLNQCLKRIYDSHLEQPDVGWDALRLERCTRLHQEISPCLAWDTDIENKRRIYWRKVTDLVIANTICTRYRLGCIKNEVAATGCC